MRPSRDPAVRAEALRMYKTGSTQTEICATLHIGTKTLRKWLGAEYVEPKPEKVLTPAPFARGYRWGGV